MKRPKTKITFQYPRICVIYGGDASQRQELADRFAAQGFGVVDKPKNPYRWLEQLRALPEKNIIVIDEEYLTLTFDTWIGRNIKGTLEFLEIGHYKFNLS